MDELPVSPFISRPRPDNTGPSRDLRDLPESILYSILVQVSEKGEGFSHALVCRKWAQIGMEAQRRVLVREGASITDSDLLNELGGFPNLRELKMKRSAALRLTDKLFLGIGATCPRLEYISILKESSTRRAGFSTEGIQGMISSLPGLKSIVLGAQSSREWNVPESVSSLRNLKVLVVGSPSPSLGSRSRLSSHPSVPRIPPSTRELSFCNRNSWHVAGVEGGLQGVRLLNAEATLSDDIPDSLWTACSLRSLTITTFNCPHLSTGVSWLTTLRQLHLHLDTVTDLPDCFSTLQLLTQLRLRSSSVQDLPDSLWSLTSLEHLSLDCDNVRSIDRGVGGLQTLTCLEVSSKQRLSFPSSLCDHSALCTLRLVLPLVQPGFELRARSLTGADIHLSRGTDLGRFLRGCSSLSSLSLGSIQDASSLLGDTGIPCSLKNLTIRWGRELTLPNSLGRYSNLETLEICGSDSIEKLPSSIVECVKLTTLTLMACTCLRNLPPQLGSLVSLHTLHITLCYGLQCLPESLGQPSLEVLVLGALSNLRSIPNSLGEAHRLRTLSIWSCKRLNCLPESVGQLALLTSLSVQTDCPLLKELPMSMSQLPSLSVLELIGLPALQSLPEGVKKMSTLHSMVVKHCESLRELPSELGQLKDLRKMVIESCHTLGLLPPSIGDLVHLKRLHRTNLPSLSCIPQQIGQLSSLRDLIINDLPSLTSLPDSMTRLTGLAELVIKDCPSLAWVPELLENLSEISEESRLGLRELMETGALRGVQQRRS